MSDSAPRMQTCLSGDLFYLKRNKIKLSTSWGALFVLFWPNSLPPFSHPQSIPHPFSNNSDNNYFGVGIYPPNLVWNLYNFYVFTNIYLHITLCPQYPITGFILNVSHQNWSWVTPSKMDPCWYKQNLLIHCVNAIYLILTIILTLHLGYFLSWVAIVK